MMAPERRSSSEMYTIFKFVGIHYFQMSLCFWLNLLNEQIPITCKEIIGKFVYRR